MDASLDQLTRGRGLRRKDMTPEERREHDNALQRKRARQYRKRHQRREEAEAKERATSLTTAQRKAALDVTAHLSEKVDLVVARRVRKAARLLGTRAEDATFDTFAAVNRSIAGTIARDERDHDELLIAAEWLSRQPGIPDVDPREAPPHARWLMNVIEYRSRSAIKAWYDHEASLDALATSLDATSHDDFYDHFHADQAPTIMGARYPRPGSLDPALVQMVLAGAITAHGLDALVETVLANLRSDGSFSWSKHAEEVFVALGLTLHWHLLDMKGASPELRGRYARGAARRALAFIQPTMDHATKMIERGYWVPPDPKRIHIQQTLATDPNGAAKVLTEALRETNAQTRRPSNGT